MLSPGEVLLLDDEAPAAPTARPTSGQPQPRSRLGLMTFDEATRRCLEEALEASGGRIRGPGGAAALLGLKPTTLVSKLEKLGVSRAKPGGAPGSAPKQRSHRA